MTAEDDDSVKEDFSGVVSYHSLAQRAQIDRTREQDGSRTTISFSLRLPKSKKRARGVYPRKIPK